MFETLCELTYNQQVYYFIIIILRNKVNNLIS